MIGKLTQEQIEEVLTENILGRLGCSVDNNTYIVPNNYVFDGKHIIAHSTGGMKIEMMRKNPRVCFVVDEIKDFSNWRSVIAWGEYQEITAERERYEAMKLFVDKTLKLKISETAIPPELSAERVHPRSPGNIRPVIYRIVITETSGRYEKDK
jgi:nitroimidazol reductase NimA-like FMN-containing flavoprotein (pyridoxamine 5'-phosphate oxidase superfamily)